MAGEKDRITEDLRQEILEDGAFVLETDRADALLITLAFQSRVKPERHVWIDTRMGESGAGYTVDLEDWTYEGSWDNAVATVDTESGAQAAEAVRGWLRGDSLDAVLARCGDATITRK